MPVILRIKEKWEVILSSPYRFKDSLSVFGSFQADLFPDQVCVLPLHLGTSFGLRFNPQQVILMSQLHFMFNGSYEEKKHISITTCLKFLLHYNQTEMIETLCIK